MKIVATNFSAAKLDELGERLQRGVAPDDRRAYEAYRVAFRFRWFEARYRRFDGGHRHDS